MPATFSTPVHSQLLNTQDEIQRAVDDIDFLAGGFWDDEELPIEAAIQQNVCHWIPK